MKPSPRFALTAALCASFLLGTAAPSHAGATPLAHGSGTPQAPGPDITFTFSMVQLPGGALLGQGMLHNNTDQGWIQFDLTSVMFIGDTVLMAGPITKTFNAPPFAPVGGTVFFGLNDNGNGDGSPVPDSFAHGFVPPFLPPNLTIQQIIGMTGPPPPEVYNPIGQGDFVVH